MPAVPLPVPSAHSVQRAFWGGRELLPGVERSGGAWGWMQPCAAESPNLSVSSIPVQLGAAAQELVTNLDAAAEPGLLCSGRGAGAWPVLRGAQPAPVAFLGSPPLLWSPRHSEALLRPPGMLVVQCLACGVWACASLCRCCLICDMSQVEQWLPPRSVF